MLDDICEVAQYDSAATALINEKIDKGWVIINTFQYENREEGEAYGTVLMGIKKDN